MFYEQLKQACKKESTSITATLKKIGIGTANGTYWKNGSVPSSDIVVQLSEFLNVSTDYLLKGVENNSSTINLTTDEQELLDIYKKLSEINKAKVKERASVLAELEMPVTNEPVAVEEPEEKRLKINCSTYQVSAGAGFELGEGDEWYEIEVPDTSKARKADFALQIKGNSMEPIYFNGDIVLVKEQPSVELGEIGIFNIEGNGYIKKFGGNRLISLNAEYDDIEFSDYDEERIRCFGKVIGRI